MMYMLDTNICIYILKKKPLAVLDKFKSVDPGQLCLSVITLAELAYGVEKSTQKAKNQKIVHAFTDNVLIHPWDGQAATHYAATRCFLEKNGNPIGPLDLMIAAHAMSIGATVVTNNLREFTRIPTLKVENWLDEMKLH